MRMIVANAGLDGAVVVEQVRELHAEGKKNFGYDVMAEAYRDMLEAGIIDPVKVTRSAFENACSIAAMILTTEALITDIPERKKERKGPSGGDDYGEDYDEV
jgi:chaperonin GroEL